MCSDPPQDSDVGFKDRDNKITVIANISQHQLNCLVELVQCTQHLTRERGRERECFIGSDFHKQSLNCYTFIHLLPTCPTSQ